METLVSLLQLQANTLPVSATFLLLCHYMHAYAKMPKSLEESASDVDVTNQLIPSVALGTSLRDSCLISFCKSHMQPSSGASMSPMSSSRTKRSYCEERSSEMIYCSAQSVLPEDEDDGKYVGDKQRMEEKRVAAHCRDGSLQLGLTGTTLRPLVKSVGSVISCCIHLHLDIWVLEL